MEANRRLRRARALVGWWDGHEFALRNYLTGKVTRVAPIVTQILNAFTAYVLPSAARRELEELNDVDALLSQLVDRDILLIEGTAIDRRDAMLEQAWHWGHDARCFHFATRDVPYETDLGTQRESLLQLMASEAPPAVFKTVEGPKIPLAKGFSDLEARLGTTLLGRRTVRRFGVNEIGFDVFSRVMLWTWGMTHFVESGEIGPYVLKTSPSGGARHSIEVYPLVSRVTDIVPGIYHYSVRDHALSSVRPGLTGDEITRYFAGQPWLRDAAAICVMTSRIERSHWKYRHSHAFRVLLLDAGHLGQTFHLVCTAMGLAPFTLAAFHDTSLEAALRIDGIGEVLLYAAALGHPQD